MIDIEKEREWWGCESEALKQVAFSDAEDRAIRYLDEIERLSESPVGSGKIIEELLAERDTLRAQLTDQRARDIRMMAHDLVLARAARGEGANLEESVLVAADFYDHLSAIKVPPPASEKAGES